jgi:hypothetical protein
MRLPRITDYSPDVRFSTVTHYFAGSEFSSNLTVRERRTSSASTDQLQDVSSQGRLLFLIQQVLLEFVKSAISA